MPFIITSDEWLEIDGIPLATPAWIITDLSELMNGPDVRGEDQIIPGAPGVKPLPRHVHVSLRSLPMVIYGGYDWEGNPYSDGHEGVETNLAYLVENLLLPPGTADGTRAAVLHLWNGDIRTGDVHVISPLRTATELGPAGLRAILELSIPAGYLAPDYS